ncbi:MAG: AAA family ATPase [Nocardioides sp.]|uniref:AAA family ATPase n=1 Tax=Nocardioides sp. TaxID=35761 RepID=UPI003267D0D4
MIIWINGTFGSGKTTIGTVLADRVTHLRTFDPEWVGYMLRNNLPDHGVTDFQQFESWRRLVPVVADEITRSTGQTLVAVQTVLDETYWNELEAGLADLGHEVFHVVLEADEGITRKRIEADEVETTALQWRLDHLPTYAASRPWLVARAHLLLDTTALTPRDAAEHIWKAVTERAGQV